MRLEESNRLAEQLVRRLPGGDPRLGLAQALLTGVALLGVGAAVLGYCLSPYLPQSAEVFVVSLLAVAACGLVGLCAAVALLLSLPAHPAVEAWHARYR